MFTWQERFLETYHPRLLNIQMRTFQRPANIALLNKRTVTGLELFVSVRSSVVRVHARVKSEMSVYSPA